MYVLTVYFYVSIFMGGRFSNSSSLTRSVWKELQHLTQPKVSTITQQTEVCIDKTSNMWKNRWPDKQTDMQVKQRHEFVCTERYHLSVISLHAVAAGKERAVSYCLFCYDAIILKR